MRLKIVAVALAFVIIHSMPIYAEMKYKTASEYYRNPGVVQCPKYCNIRQKPTTSSKVVGVIQNNGVVEVLSSGDDWYAVKSGTVSGYIMSDYVTLNPDLMESVSTLKVCTKTPCVVYSSKNTNSKVWERPTTDTVYNVVDCDNTWVQIDLDGGTGYLLANDSIELFYGMEEANPTYSVAAYSETRQNIVKYAMQFLGNQYVWGGNDPHTGADCSGFVKYVYEHLTDINLPRVSYEQCYAGTKISSLDMKPGDLIFYANADGVVNHVALYIGNSTIIHAASTKSGIKLSQWNYRTPKYIRRLLND